MERLRIIPSHVHGILDYAREVPLIYLTTHDVETAQRLIHRTHLLSEMNEARV